MIETSVMKELKTTGINTKTFTAHSSRNANSSVLFMKALSIRDIVQKRRVEILFFQTILYPPASTYVTMVQNFI